MTDKNTIYLDYAAATPLDPSVRDAMRAYDDASFANAFSIHQSGREAKRHLEDARFSVAKELGVASHECIFTNGATDAATKAIYGVINPLLESGKTYTDIHIVMSVIEHSTIRSCVEGFARRGTQVSMIGVDADGVIDLSQLKDALRDSTALVVSMMVNNEIGTIQPIRDIRRILNERYSEAVTRPVLLVDASQAPLCLPVKPKELGVDLLVLDGGKIYGPKRSGLLFVEKGTQFSSLCGVFGKTVSDGTPDVGMAIGFAKALEIADRRQTPSTSSGRATDDERWGELKSYLVEQLKARFADVRIHGNPSVSVSNIVNISFPNIEGEFLASQLDAQGIAVSAKSACLSEGGEGSYVVAALDRERANNSCRISFGRETTQEELDVLVSTLADIIKQGT